jgi:hypothetical protein
VFEIAGVTEYDELEIVFGTPLAVTQCVHEKLFLRIVICRVGTTAATHAHAL